jgi:hypothetical protein
LPIEQFSAIVTLLPTIEVQLSEQGVEVPRPEYDGDRSRVQPDTAEQRDDEDDLVANVEGKKSNIEATSDEDDE